MAKAPGERGKRAAARRRGARKPAPSTKADLAAENAALRRALARGATDVLRLIASSRGDAQPVFDAIARQALTLCDADYGVVVRYDGEVMVPVGLAHLTAEGMKEMAARGSMRADRRVIGGRAILDRAVVHVPDIAADLDYDPGFRAALQAASGLGVPMLRDGAAVGAITVGRLERRA